MTVKEALVIVLMACAGMTLIGYVSWHEGYERALTESCQASCAESGYDASTLEDNECVCIQFSVME